MSFNNPMTWVPSLEEAMDSDPLILPPETPLEDAISLIGQSHQICSIAMEPWTELASNPSTGGCVLAIQDGQLVGIFTERDVVRLAAQNKDFQGMTLAEVMTHPVVVLPRQSVQDLFAALFLFRRYRIRHLPIVDEQEHLLGVISHESIRQILRPANLLRFRRVADVMISQVVQAPMTASVLELAQLMANHRISCVVIVRHNEKDLLQPVGIVTERDIVQFQALQIDLSKTQAQSVMSSPLFLLSPEDSLWTAHQEMQKRRVGRLVVAWNWGMELGIVTQTNLLRVFDPMEMYGVIENLQRTIQQLEQERSPQLTTPPHPIPSSVSGTETEGAFSLDRKTLTLDREIFQTALNKMQTSLQRLMQQPQCSNEPTQGELQSIATILGQLSHLGNLCVNNRSSIDIEL
jgi:CBS domain-containing protein